MLDNTAEAAQSSIWTGPCFEPGLDGRYDAFKLHKVLIVQAAASDQHPDSLNRVEFGAVGTRDQILMMQQQPTAWIPLPKGIQILTGNESRHRYRPGAVMMATMINCRALIRAPSIALPSSDGTRAFIDPII